MAGDWRKYPRITIRKWCDSGKEMYDTLSDSIFPTACRRRYAAGVDSLESKDYDQAIEYLTKVVKMDESYNDGQAIYRLAQAYHGKGCY